MKAVLGNGVFLGKLVKQIMELLLNKNVPSRYNFTNEEKKSLH